jgi:hypothetical protein
MGRTHRGKRSPYSRDKRLALHTSWRDKDLGETICRVHTVYFKDGEVLIDPRREGSIQ